jgi:hypothetical protein
LETGAAKSAGDHCKLSAATLFVPVLLRNLAHMAPILASCTGVAPSAIEDPALRELHNKLCSLPSKIENIPDLRALADLLEPYSLGWPFDEQVI